MMLQPFSDVLPPTRHPPNPPQIVLPTRNQVEDSQSLYGRSVSLLSGLIRSFSLFHLIDLYGIVTSERAEPKCACQWF